MQLYQSSPRTWGCFPSMITRRTCSLVFPTHVGVFLRYPRFTAPRSCLPHARGGVSNDLALLAVASESSPRTWGCFRQAKKSNRCCFVFPTHVGVFLAESLSPIRIQRLSHARGGVSRGGETTRCRRRSSPRTWGCFYRRGQREKMGRVFPTHVGVFHARGGLVRFWHCLPHARGGAPSRGCPPKAPSSRLGLFTSTLDIDSFIWREWQKGRRTCLNIF